jgi:uncharacterized membrane protein YedE/YeeE
MPFDTAGVSFSPVPALIGGALIGSAAALLLHASGRIAGVSGILGAALAPRTADRAWRVAFVLGLPLGALLWASVSGRPAGVAMVAPPGVLVVAGLLVGFGTQLGSGCTSGHGVCGLARRSLRSVVATLTFMAVGALTVWLRRRGLGL